MSTLFDNHSFKQLNAKGKIFSFDLFVLMAGPEFFLRRNIPILAELCIRINECMIIRKVSSHANDSVFVYVDGRVFDFSKFFSHKSYTGEKIADPELGAFEEYGNMLEKADKIIVELNDIHKQFSFIFTKVDEDWEWNTNVCNHSIS